MTVEISTYKGHPILTINPGLRSQFGFGLGKALLILDEIEAIKAFVRTGGASVDPSKAAAETSK